MSAPAALFQSASTAFPSAGIRRRRISSVFVSRVLIGTYVGIGALAHDFGFSSVWLALSTILVWAAPAQVIMISALGTGAALFEAALAVTSERHAAAADGGGAVADAARTGHAPARPAAAGAFHRRSACGWSRCGLLPRVPREQRIAFCNGLSVGFCCTAVHAAAASATISPRLAAAASRRPCCSSRRCRSLLSTVRNSPDAGRQAGACVSASCLGPSSHRSRVDLDLMWTGIIGGTIAYAVHRLREAVPMNRRWTLNLALSRADPGRLSAERGLARCSGFCWRAASTKIPRSSSGSRAVATAMLAGVIAQADPVSQRRTRDVPLAVRVGAAACGFAAFSGRGARCSPACWRAKSALLLGGFFSC